MTLLGGAVCVLFEQGGPGLCGGLSILHLKGLASCHIVGRLQQLGVGAKELRTDPNHHIHRQPIHVGLLIVSWVSALLRV